MAFFDELSKKAQAYAGVAVEKARDLADTASEKARAAADSAKISMAISTEQREMEKNYRAIGEWFVSEYEGEIPDAVKDVVAAVLASKEKIAELEASKPKKEDAPEDVIEVEPMAETEKTCPVCGAAFVPQGRQLYCSAACQAEGNRQKSRARMRNQRAKHRGRRYD